jgi:hypothetical protein
MRQYLKIGPSRNLFFSVWRQLISREAALTREKTGLDAASFRQPTASLLIKPTWPEVINKGPKIVIA